MWMEEEVLQQLHVCGAAVQMQRLMGQLPLLQPRLPQVLGDIHGNVEEGEVGDGEALALEAEKRGE
jgi:hypothetical protein